MGKCDIKWKVYSRNPVLHNCLTNNASDSFALEPGYVLLREAMFGAGEAPGFALDEKDTNILAV